MRPFVSVLVGSVLVTALTHGDAWAQEVLYTLVSPNEESQGYFGSSVAAAGDVNNDGHDDVIVGAYHEHAGGYSQAGHAYIFSGATGDTLYTLVSPNQVVGGRFGYSASGAGDVNNDGYADVIVGAMGEDPGTSPSDAGRAYVFSGATGDTLYTLVSPNEQGGGSFGNSVSGAGDVNGDGYADVIVGAYQEHPGGSPLWAGRAYVFDGPTGDTVYTLVSPNEESQGYFGSSVAAAGDVDSDGYADVLVGAPHEDCDSTDAGRAYIFSGQTGAVLYTLVSPNQGVWGLFGESVSGAGDVNSDGCADVIVGAQREGPGSSPIDAGRAYIFSGATGDTLYALVSPNEQLGGRFGVAVSGAGDVDDDGTPDVVVGAQWEFPGGSPWRAGRAYVFSGATGRVLDTLVSQNEEWDGNFGYRVSGAGDVDSDGYADAIIGAYHEDCDSTDAGRAYVFSFRPSWSAPDGGVVGSYELLLDGPYPNPSDGSVRLAVRVPHGGVSPATLSLYDVSGRLVATLWQGDGSGEGVRIIRSDTYHTLPPGMYAVTLTQANMSVTKRVVILH